MKVALTGGSGFLGQALLREYAGSHEFVVLTPRADTSNLFADEAVEYVQIPRVGADPSADGEASSLYRMALKGCNAAANLGFARPRPGRADSFDDYLPSIRATELFLTACAEEGVTNVVHASSRSVYDQHATHPHCEIEPVAPFSNYGAAKAAAENLASALGQLHGLSIKTLRFSQLVGNNEYQGVVSTYLKAAKQGQPLQIWGTGNETARDYLYVRDASAAILAALAKPEVSGVFNIGSGTTTTVNDLVAALENLIGANNMTVERLPEKQVAHSTFALDVAKADRILNWHAAWPLHSALAAMLADEDGAY